MTISIQEGLARVMDWFTLGATGVTPNFGNGAPYFHADLTVNQSGVASSTATKCALNSVAFDSNSGWSGTNFRWTPNKPGKYRVSGLLGINATSQTLANGYIYKNGVLLYQGAAQSTISLIGGCVVSIDGLVSMNGTTDYVEMWGFSTGTGVTFQSGGSTYFEAFYVGP